MFYNFMQFLKNSYKLRKLPPLTGVGILFKPQRTVRLQLGLHQDEADAVPPPSITETATGCDEVQVTKGTLSFTSHRLQHDCPRCS